MTAPTPNVDLLRRTLAYIEEHPKEWKQDTWRCGTTACFAGHAAMLDGGMWASSGSSALVARPDDLPSRIYTFGGMDLVPVEDRAQRVLGLTDEQAFDLFRGSNSLNDLRRIVAELTGGCVMSPVPTHTYRLARLPEDQPAARCELTELLVDQCAHCVGVADLEAESARHSYELAARTGGAR